MKVYVYKEYCDECAYGEEIIKVFANKVDAEAFLKNEVETYYGMEWNEIEGNNVDEDDLFDTDYVSIDSGQGVLFWIVEEQEVIE